MSNWPVVGVAAKEVELSYQTLEAQSLESGGP